MCKKGVSLVELVVAIAILSIILGAIYQFFFFGQRSLGMSQAESEVLAAARSVSLLLEKEIPPATRPVFMPNLPLAVSDEQFPSEIRSHYAVEIDEVNQTAQIYTFVSGDPKKVIYRVIEENDVTRIERAVVQPHILMASVDASAYGTVISHISPLDNEPYFKIHETDKNVILIQLQITDEGGRLRKPIAFKRTFTVRGKDAMPS